MNDKIKDEVEVILGIENFINVYRAYLDNLISGNHSEMLDWIRKHEIDCVEMLVTLEITIDTVKKGIRLIHKTKND